MWGFRVCTLKTRREDDCALPLALVDVETTCWWRSGWMIYFNFQITSLNSLLWSCFCVMSCLVYDLTFMMFALFSIFIFPSCFITLLSNLCFHPLSGTLLLWFKKCYINLKRLFITCMQLQGLSQGDQIIFRNIIIHFCTGTTLSLRMTLVGIWFDVWGVFLKSIQWYNLEKCLTLVFWSSRWFMERYGQLHT